MPCTATLTSYQFCYVSITCVVLHIEDDGFCLIFKLIGNSHGSRGNFTGMGSSAVVLCEWERAWNGLVRVGGNDNTTFSHFPRRAS